MQGSISAYAVWRFMALMSATLNFLVPTTGWVSDLFVKHDKTRYRIWSLKAFTVHERLWWDSLASIADRPALLESDNRFWTYVRPVKRLYTAWIFRFRLRRFAKLTENQRVGLCSSSGRSSCHGQAISNPSPRSRAQKQSTSLLLQVHMRLCGWEDFFARLVIRKQDRLKFWWTTKVPSKDRKSVV